MTRILLALAGAVAGGVLGYYAFIWIARQGFYALVLPGALVGLGAALARNRRVWVAVVCGVLALLVGIVADQSISNPPYDSLRYYVLHLHQQPPITLIMLAIGGLLGLFIPYPRRDGAPRR